MLLLKILLFIFKLIKADCPFKQTENNQIVKIKNFNNLSELNFNQCKEPIINVNNWELKPNKKIILDNTLNLKGLIFMLNNKSDTIFFHLSNFRGFDLLSDPFKEIKFLSKTDYIYKIWFIESSSIFNFYINNKLINEKECLNNSNNKNWNNFITNSESYLLSINAYFSLNTCPYIFEKTSIYMIIFNNIIASLINSNKLTFISIKNSSLNSSIIFAQFQLYRVEFDDNLFNEAIFKATLILQIDGILNGIQNDLFKSSFNNLKIIRIQTQYVKQIFATNNKWLEYLNFNLNPIDLDASSQETKITAVFPHIKSIGKHISFNFK